MARGVGMAVLGVGAVDAGYEDCISTFALGGSASAGRAALAGLDFFRVAYAASVAWGSLNGCVAWTVRSRVPTWTSSGCVVLDGPGAIGAVGGVELSKACLRSG